MSAASPVPIPGFATRRIDVGEVTINAAVGGAGPPLLLLHGYPQNHQMWRGLAPALAERFTVVAADLRGYGDSDAPPAGEDGAGYAKRAMAADQVALMRELGFARFAVAGHDRGGRVAHRMALDHPEVVSRLAVLDIVPTRIMFADVSKTMATVYYHWFFLIQPDGLPERMIGADPVWFLRETLRRWSAPGHEFDPVAMAEYERCFSRPEVIRASCDDYRAAAGIDLEHDAADRELLGCPLLSIAGARGRIAQIFDIGATWRELAGDVTAVELDCAHFVVEERPTETLDHLLSFLVDP